MTTSELKKPPLKDLKKIQANIVFGYEKIENLVEKATPIEIREAGPTDYFSEGPSCVWIVDKLSVEFPHIVEHYKKTLDLKRILIYALDHEDFVRVISNSKYYQFFVDPRVRFVLLDSGSLLSEDIAREAFALTDNDHPNETRFFYSFAEANDQNEELKHHLLHLHESLHAIYGEDRSLEWGVNTYDRFRGFSNHIHNLRELLTTGDIRRWGNVASGLPGIIIGAGPSINSQFDFLRRVQDQAVLLAADTMLKPLAKEGIRPHIIVSLERDECIIPLLNDEAEHPETILLGASVLEPDCFRVFRGPRTLFNLTYPYNRWLGLARSELGAGHSCVGIAMACASYIGCGTMFLAGIDLSWSPEGEAHSDTVPYHEDESYRSRYSARYKKSFIKRNNLDGEVRTHLYWSLFQRQFEGWITKHPGNVFNLSPTGVKIRGAPYVELKSKAVTEALNKDHPEIPRLLLDHLDYERTQETKVALQKLIPRCQDLLQRIPELEVVCKTGKRKDILQAFANNPHYEFLLLPLFKGDLRRLEEVEDFQTDEIEKSQANFIQYLPELKNVIEDCQKTAETLIRENVRLFA